MEDREILTGIIIELGGKLIEIDNLSMYKHLDVMYVSYEFTNECNDYTHNAMICTCYCCYVAFKENSYCGYAMKYSNERMQQDKHFDTFQDAIRFLHEKNMTQKLVNSKAFSS